MLARKIVSPDAPMLTPWLDLLACHGCRVRLHCNEEKSELHCPHCRVGHPFRDGVLRCLDLRDDEPEDLIKRQEIQARDDGALAYDNGDLSLGNRIEIPACVAALRPAPSDDVAELGCGTGRLTLHYLHQVRRVVAVDFSLESLRLLRQRVPADLRNRLLLVQADITTAPLTPAVFNKVASFQVLEHLPTPLSRQAAFSRAADLLRPGGAFILSVYNWSLSKRRDAGRGVGDYTAKEGYHDSGIYYYNFEEHEVRQLLESAGLSTESIEGLLIPLRGGSLLGPLVVPLNRWLGRTGFGIRRGHLLLARGGKPVHADRHSRM